MGAPHKFTAAEMAEAITGANGILAGAAKALGCSRTTVTNYINKYATVKDAFEEANETNIDYVESQLMKQINAGNATSTIFFLKTKAKHRGYVERQEITGSDGNAIQVEAVDYRNEIANIAPRPVSDSDPSG